MSIPKKPGKSKQQLKTQLSKELNFLKNVFSVLTLPTQIKDENEDDVTDKKRNNSEANSETKELPKRARSIAELEEKLEKIKSQHNFNLKNKLVKKSLSSKLNKKIKKQERINKKKVKPIPSEDTLHPIVEQAPEKPKESAPKPVFNNDSKLVFSKFDFSDIGQNKKTHRAEKDPKKILENLKNQEQRFKELEENQEGDKVKQIKEKMAWKTILQKAEGQKIKDDPTLLKKSIKKMEHKKKQSSKQWENRVQNVSQKKEDRQKRRKENISKKKKEKKSKIVKTAIKRGRVVI